MNESTTPGAAATRLAAPPTASRARFSVTYSLRAHDSDEAEATAFGIAVEQTIEFPYELLRHDEIRDHLVGRVESILEVPDGKAVLYDARPSESAGLEADRDMFERASSKASCNRYEAVVSYDVRTAGAEQSQLLNVIFGNTSIKPGIRVEGFQLTEAQEGRFPGPRFGVDGLRELTGTASAPRPLVCSALKPMGLTVQELAELARAFVRGGIDVIKDDHGLADQAFSPFEERVVRCADAVREVNEATGSRCLYAPNVTADSEQELLRRAVFARDAGATALVLSVGLAGWNALRLLSTSDEVALPILMHPALLGSFTASTDSGLAHRVLYGDLARLLGADAAIFPNYGGRFSFSREECASIRDACAAPRPHRKPILPAPGGGMELPRIEELTSFYGNDVLFLMGGGLFRSSNGLEASCRAFRALVEGQGVRANVPK